MQGLHLSLGDLCAADVRQYVRIQDEFRTSVISTYWAKDEEGKVLWNAISGSIKLFDALALKRAVEVVKPRKILEIGSFLGFSTRWILEASRPFNSTVTSLDPRLRHRIFDDLKDHVIRFASDNRERLTCVDAFFSYRTPEAFLSDLTNFEPKFSQEAAVEKINSVPVVDSRFDNFDLIFIDGDHSWKATFENVKLAATMLNAGGIIVLHDAISWPDVAPGAKKAIEELQDFHFVGVSGEEEREFYGRWWSTITGPVEIGSTTWHLQNSVADGLGFIWKQPARQPPESMFKKISSWIKA